MAQKKAALACSVCGSRNYTLTLGQNKRDERFELKKFCTFCNKQTLPRETKYSRGAVSNAFFSKCC